MLVKVGQVEREVKVMRMKNGTYRCKVGKATVIWNKKYKSPYVMLPGSTLEEINKAKPLLIAFLKQYKALVSVAKKPAPMSFEGEGQTDTPYKFNSQESKDGYVSSVPKWLRESKIKQVCSGPHRTFTRGIRIPADMKQLAIDYAPYCASCQYRADCQAPCLYPAEKSQEEIMVGLQ